MVRVALLSDTHGSLDQRIRAVAVGCDRIVHAGDIGGRQVLDELTDGSGRLLAITGNNDVPAKWPPDEEDLLKQLPSEAALDLPGGRLVVIEAGPADGGGLGGLLGRRRADPYVEAGGAVPALEAAGFRPVRVLGEREGYRFIEGLKP